MTCERDGRDTEREVLQLVLDEQDVEIHRLARMLLVGSMRDMALAEDETDMFVESFSIGLYDPMLTPGEQIRSWLEEEHGYDIVYEHGKSAGLW